MDLEQMKSKMQEIGRLDDVQNVENHYNSLSAKEEVEVSVRRNSFSKADEILRLGELALAIRQIYLHRANKLFEGSCDALLKDNVYLMSLAIRGHFETTAALGYLHNRLSSFKKGNISLEVLAKNMASLILGTGDEDLPDEGYEDVHTANNVMMMLDYADKSFSKQMGGTTREHKFLRDAYQHLCEYSHPNFHSNKLGYEIDEEREVFVIMHGEDLPKDSYYIIGYLFISAPAFLSFFEDIDNLLPA